jgi:hypothetical protein
VRSARQFAGVAGRIDTIGSCVVKKYKTIKVRKMIEREKNRRRWKTRRRGFKEVFMILTFATMGLRAVREHIGLVSIMLREYSSSMPSSRPRNTLLPS